MKPNELIGILEKNGWFSTGQNGSHRKFRHDAKPGLIIVPVHSGKEIGAGLLHSILKKAGLK